ncbi:WecB/TagA/CpsF family glycosyltransferase [Methylobacterium iners]|uniref:N-acetylglucosaminyldiphosphoundecaprenol N-acetyl-beta-D-mannosaminyltransferase n=1 Tax=Methylobacterium iners TaxID=418707 RepID=A0ABQ4RUF9_9HYPH|nr:WecB/TagA/CpsF family glycosyltransferase [Methylobacterium iners]GJD93252.1 N-acetylglucosaminyldiphosphoundecaprenol N-acetyl-beta-D-mannosaminyltransferase [Methylobacterium iners]
MSTSLETCSDPVEAATEPAGPRERHICRIGGLPIAATDRAEAAELMAALALGRRGTGRPPAYITSANGQVLSVCAGNPELRRLFETADIIHADGMSLVFAARLLSRQPLPERVATTDLFHDVAGLAERYGLSFYLLGATPEGIARATSAVRRQYPNLRIAGSHHGYTAPEDEAALVRSIAAAAPDILWIGMGVPREQRFAVRWREQLAGVGVIKTSGGLFDFLSGASPRAPRWMQSCGLEWLYRMLNEPGRLGLRYLTTNPHAVYILLRQTR